MCDRSAVNDQRLRFLLSGAFAKVWMARHDEVLTGIRDLRIIIQEERRRTDAEGHPSHEGTAIASWLESHMDKIREEMRRVARHQKKYPASSGVEEVMELRRVERYDTTQPHCACKAA